MNFESLNFSFSPRASTVQYGGVSVNEPATLGGTVTGNVLDHNYTFEIERIAEQGARRNINGSAHAEWLVNSLIQYQVKFEFKILQLAWERPTFRDHLSAISTAIGKTIVYRGANFYPKTDINYIYRKNPLHMSFYEVISGSFAEILNKLIGWSGDVPAMVINMYIENGVIYLVQRGYENNTAVTVPAWSSLPTLTHSIRHTQWANSQTQTITPKQISSSDAMTGGEPFTGTITWGSTSLTYEDGYLTQETRANETITYTYTDANEGKYLSQKEILYTDPDTGDQKYTISTYSYESTATEVYLHEETTATYEGSDDTGTLESSTLTRHVPTSNGWYGSTTYDTTEGKEEFISDSLSQGAPGQKASQYMIDKSNDALKDSQSPRQITVPLNGVAKARQAYPIADRTTLQAIANCLDAYEGAEEITLTASINGGTHIYTYDDVINYNGNSYKLVSNSVNRTYDSVVQNITAVRYVLPS